ncbi:bifunctional GNAT family N-acetyltransferase/class I SAM-dependent methyltransferase [Streptomyces sp. NPDC001851]|uniref:bifunctional GNAT family N-acetyltransferase/class I SAM-dependent methyltransferase n=1 Tax=Streptomyces sp. NPDC001851 TaxID=3154529 RepID=UPI003325051C
MTLRITVPKGHEVLALTPDDGPALQDLLQRCDDYSRLTFGIPTGAADAQSQFLEGLQHVPEERKHLVGCRVEGRLVAAADLLEGYPDARTAALGMLVIDPEWRGRGLGTGILLGLGTELAGRGVKRLRVDCHVAENTRAVGLLKRLGFTESSREEITVAAGQTRTRVLWTADLPLRPREEASLAARSDYSRAGSPVPRPVPPLDRLLELPGVNAVVEPYYFDSPLFDDYERDVERRTGETDWDLAGLASAVGDGARVLEAGCGTGRALVHLAATTKASRLVGVDTSRPALARARARAAAAGTDQVEFVEGDFLAYRPATAFDAVLLADCTLNGFTDESAAVGLLTHARSLLAPGGRIAVSVFDDGAPATMSHLDGRTVVDSFADRDGCHHIVIWSMRFDADTALLHRTAAVPRSASAPGEPVTCVISDMYDRIWTPSTLSGLFTAAGLSVTGREPATLDSGAAGGAPTVTLVLTPV